MHSGLYIRVHLYSLFSGNVTFLFHVTLCCSPTPPCFCTESTRTPSGRASAPRSCSPRRWPPCSPSPPARWARSRWGRSTPPSSLARCCTRAARPPSRRWSSPHYGWGPAPPPTTCTHSLCNGLKVNSIKKRWKDPLVCMKGISSLFVLALIVTVDNIDIFLTDQVNHHRINLGSS